MEIVKSANARNTHAFKGSVANFGALNAFHLALQIETAGREGRIAGVESLLEKLEEESGRIKQSLLNSGK